MKKIIATLIAATFGFSLANVQPASAYLAPNGMYGTFKKTASCDMRKNLPSIIEAKLKTAGKDVDDVLVARINADVANYAKRTKYDCKRFDRISEDQKQVAYENVVSAFGQLTWFRSADGDSALKKKFNAGIATLNRNSELSVNEKRIAAVLFYAEYRFAQAKRTGR